MVSFWWEKSSATSLSLKTSALKLFTEADLLYQLSLLNQIILFQLSLPTPPPPPQPQTQHHSYLFPFWLQHLKARGCMTFTWHVQNE